MDKKWFATKELLGVAGLPTSRQGLNKRANENGWEKRRRKGVQGKGVEYAIWSLPDSVQRSLMMEESPTPEYITSAETELLPTWIQVYHQLTGRERTLLINYILHEGALAMLARLDSSLPASDTQGVGQNSR
ncbi:Cro/Cl family transcriptional regulator [Lonsdalea britannica]|uniref:Cro/Cl family transcriptional regulator n=1 Tax=Lonsdalea britannica TaxID=1082704 RepID=A0AAD0SKQ1_9GAMM|nr:DNA-binding protein [Lonsdalea britannica]AXW86903.1 Cro/Cl family transcriptional regulator [Lonsdalea britannica]OSM97007.1 Cro/Cl family transcriptional regulator [Lonsdalea britannica]OSN07749.1 Cro/Cl family transcriptional regulator [Lonsdalea britannica]